MSTSVQLRAVVVDERRHRGGGACRAVPPTAQRSSGAAPQTPQRSCSVGLSTRSSAAPSQWRMVPSLPTASTSSAREAEHPVDQRQAVRELHRRPGLAVVVHRGAARELPPTAKRSVAASAPHVHHPAGGGGVEGLVPALVRLGSRRRGRREDSKRSGAWADRDTAAAASTAAQSAFRVRQRSRSVRGTEETARVVVGGLRDARERLGSDLRQGLDHPQDVGRLAAAALAPEGELVGARRSRPGAARAGMAFAASSGRRAFGRVTLGPKRDGEAHREVARRRARPSRCRRGRRRRRERRVAGEARDAWPWAPTTWRITGSSRAARELELRVGDASCRRRARRRGSCPSRARRSPPRRAARAIPPARRARARSPPRRRPRPAGAAPPRAGRAALRASASARAHCAGSTPGTRIVDAGLGARARAARRDPRRTPRSRGGSGCRRADAAHAARQAFGLASRLRARRTGAARRAPAPAADRCVPSSWKRCEVLGSPAAASACLTWNGRNALLNPFMMSCLMSASEAASGCGTSHSSLRHGRVGDEPVVGVDRHPRAEVVVEPHRVACRGRAPRRSARSTTGSTRAGSGGRRRSAAGRRPRAAGSRGRCGGRRRRASPGRSTPARRPRRRGSSR